MALKIRCLLCQGPVDLFSQAQHRLFYRCRLCSGIFLDPGYRVSTESERDRYLKHNNDVANTGYRAFIEPVVSAVEQRFSRRHTGLDFGAGTTAIAARMLQEKGYSVEVYDPFFWNLPQALEKKYDFIVCCEVMEHFHDPAKEFKLLSSLLKPAGILFCMTQLYCEDLDFNTWYYKNDSTHVFFYHRNTLDLIRERCGFSAVDSIGRIQVFSVL